MLWTTGESLHEKLPLVSPKGDLVLTADARIDNREELIALLGFGKIATERITDSQLILAAYEKWGEHCPEKLLGDFAFVVWDGHNQTLFCARDHFGMKPFCYHFQAGRIFAFASEVKAIFCLPDVPHQLNEIRIADHLASYVGDKSMTFYREIFRLPPSHSLTVDLRGARLRQYWSLDPNREIHYSSDQEYAEEFRRIFTEAVRCRLRSSYPIGAELSGGLDSSSVVCVTRQLLEAEGKHPLHTFSTLFGTVPECDERSFIQTVINQGEMEPHFVPGDRHSPLSDLDRVHWHHDQPCIFHNQFLNWTRNQAAQQMGIRVMLNGEDGDTVVCHGDAYLTELSRAARWDSFCQEAHGLSQHFGVPSGRWLHWYGLSRLRELASEGRWVAFASAARHISRGFDISCARLVLDHGLRPLVPQPIRQSWRLITHRGPRNGGFGFLIKPSFAQRVGLAEAIQARSETRPVETLREWHWLGLTGGMIPMVAEWLNRSAAAVSVDSRQPFFDRRLAEFCLALPPEQKLSQGWPRRIMRQAMEGLLPSTIQWRVGKSSLGLNFARNLSTFEESSLDEVIMKDPGVIEDFVDIPVMREVYRRFTRRPTQSDAELLWPPLNLALWLSYTGRSHGSN
jgi:asparagine synthase (glutamine-hydrolysing)